MKSLIRFALTLLIGAILGYIFHNPIDTKLKTKFGAEKVETVRAGAEEKLGNVAEKSVVVGKAAYEAGKEALDSTKSE
jgi:hypothetical protein